MIESRNEANKNLEKALRTLAQAKQKVGGEKKKQSEKKRKAEIRSLQAEYDSNRQANQRFALRSQMTAISAKG